MNVLGGPGGGVGLGGGGRVTPGGSDTHVQYNDGGDLGGDASLTYNGDTANPALTLTSASDTAADQAVLRLRRVDADGTSGHPADANLGLIVVQGRDTDGDWYDAFRITVEQSPSSGANDADGPPTTVTLAAHDGSGGYGTEITLHGDDGQINIDGPGSVTVDTASGNFIVDAALVDIQAQSTDLLLSASGDAWLTAAHVNSRSEDGLYNLYKGFASVNAELDITALSTERAFAFPNYAGGVVVNADALDPGADRLLFWDDSAGQIKYLEPSTGLTITDTAITSSGGSGVDTANSPNANEYARFTDADTIEGRTESEFKADLNLEIGTDVQAQDAFLQDIADLTDPAADRILFWDDSAGGIDWLEAGSGLSISGTTISATAATPGLVFIAGSSFSAASSVSFDNCFSSTYEHYLLVLETTGSSGSAVDVGIRMRAASSDTAGTDYTFALPGGDSTTNSVATYRATGTSYALVGYRDNTTSISASAIYVYSPAEAAVTSFNGTIVRAQSTTAKTAVVGGLLNDTTAYDGFTVLPASGTFTGYARIYGLRNS